LTIYLFVLSIFSNLANKKLIDIIEILKDRKESNFLLVKIEDKGQFEQYLDFLVSKRRLSNLSLNFIINAFK